MTETHATSGGRPADKKMNFKEARAYLEVSESTLRDYVRTGRVRAYRMGGSTGRLLFFWKADLDALFEPVAPSQAASLLDSSPMDEPAKENE